ncbi:hypothetical protein GCM10023144_27600 [Pigmentiphaga soli]|uniref:Group III truncated hemoglobin n=1 Tax=Pigmentiphaga soli TaxID=1007095 RepID=A0ABP8H617_9BURK
MPDPALCTEDDIRGLVHAFYARVRQDDALGPIFNTHVRDWDSHLAKLVDFWSSLLRGTARFSGTPMTRHAALPDLSADLFQRWLGLFRATALEQPNRAMADQACMLAGRIAQSLWMGYQLDRDPDAAPTMLATGAGTATASSAAPAAAAVKATFVSTLVRRRLAVPREPS